MKEEIKKATEFVNKSAEDKETGNHEGAETVVKTAFFKGLLNALKNTYKESIKNPHNSKIKELCRNQLLLTGLALAEIVPGIEIAKTEVLSFVKAGKKAGFFKKLYRDVPEGLQTFVNSLDLVGTPLAGATGEIWQIGANQFTIYKETFLANKDLATVALREFGKVVNPPIEARQAAQAFAA